MFTSKSWSQWDNRAVLLRLTQKRSNKSSLFTFDDWFYLWNNWTRSHWPDPINLYPHSLLNPSPGSFLWPKFSQTKFKSIKAVLTLNSSPDESKLTVIEEKILIRLNPSPFSHQLPSTDFPEVNRAGLVILDLEHQKSLSKSNFTMKKALMSLEGNEQTLNYLPIQFQVPSSNTQTCRKTWPQVVPV
jgi:hypothetical protein